MQGQLCLSGVGRPLRDFRKVHKHEPKQVAYVDGKVAWTRRASRIGPQGITRAGCTVLARLMESRDLVPVTAG